MTIDSCHGELLFSPEGAVAVAALNRPQALNAVDLPMAQGLLAAARGIAADPGVRAVPMRGESESFRGGGDLALLGASVMVQVHGVAAGAGLPLMLQANFVLAAGARAPTWPT